MSIKAVGGGVQMLEAVSAVRPLTAIVVAEAKGSITFPSFLRIAIFSHLGCQCLITGFIREEQSHCSGNGRKCSRTLLAFF